MRHPYVGPELVVHGRVHELTSASLDSDREDRIFNSAGIQTGTETGSLDECFFVPGTEDCIIAD